MSHRVLVVDVGAWAPDVAEAIEEAGIQVDGFVEFFDGRKVRTEAPKVGKPVIWWEDASIYSGSHYLIHGLGTQDRAAEVSMAQSIGFRFATFRHPTARVPKSCKLGTGVFVGPGVVMGSRTKIGNHVTINRGAIIGHDVVLNDYVTVSPGANMAGLVEIGRGTYLGMGSIILDNRKIGDYSIVGAGAVVTRDYPENHIQLLGVPARITKRNIRGK